MGLGADSSVCMTEFIEAMRTIVAADDPGAAANLDDPNVQKPFAGMALAVYRIATVRAETAASAGTDPVFWHWVAAVNAWLVGLSAWQQGMAGAFASWSPTLPADQTLKSALAAVQGPGAPPAAAPASLKGAIQ